MRSAADEGLDHNGARRLSRNETMFWYSFAAVSYIAASLLINKFLLNWFIGPVWLLAVVWAGPSIVDRARQRSRGKAVGDDRVVVE